MQKLFEKYMEGNFTAEEYEKVIAIIRKPENDKFLDDFLRVFWKNTFNSDLPIDPDKHLLNSIHHQISLIEPMHIRKARFYRRLLAVAAVLLIGLVTSVIYIIHSQKTVGTTQHITVPYGGKTHLSLPDGSKVWVNSGSTLSYPDRFSKVRVVELQGEAYFEVAHHSFPFTVKSSYGEIEALGTEFNVKAYEDQLFETTLVSGAVKFTNKYGKQAELVPGTQVFFDSEKFRRRNVETDLYTAWKDGKLIFRDTPLGIMIPRLERWYNVDIELNLIDESINDLKFTATIEMETFSEVMELIRVTTPIEYSFDKNTRILSIQTP